MNPGIATANAPNPIGRSYSVTAEVDVPQGGGNGMLATVESKLASQQATPSASSATPATRPSGMAAPATGDSRRIEGLVAAAHRAAEGRAA